MVKGVGGAADGACGRRVFGRSGRGSIYIGGPSLGAYMALPLDSLCVLPLGSLRVLVLGSYMGSHFAPSMGCLGPIVTVSAIAGFTMANYYVIYIYIYIYCIIHQL